MAYQVKSKRNAPGQYRFEYGKGSLKLVADVQLNPSGTWTGVGNGFHATCDQLQQLKEVFARWATSSYGQARVEATPTDKNETILAAVVANLSGGWPPGFDPEAGLRTFGGVSYRYYPPPEGDLGGPWRWLDKRGYSEVENRTNRYFAETESEDHDE